MFYNKPKIELELIRNCNFNCSYCGAKSPKEKILKEMDFNYLKYFLKKLKNTKDIFIILSGGEPTLYSKFINLFEECQKNNLKNIILITNFSNFNILKEIINYQPIIIFSIHLNYLNFYWKNINLINNLLQKFKTVQLQLVLNEFNQNDFKKLILLKKIITKIYNPNFFIHYQFISYGNTPNDWPYLNFKNINDWRNFLKINPKPIFYLNKTKDTTEFYYQNLKNYLKNNFEFKTCLNNNFKLLYNFDFVYECTDIKKIFNFKKNPKFNIKKLFYKKINCFCEYCDFQICGYCDKNI